MAGRTRTPKETIEVNATDIQWIKDTMLDMNTSLTKLNQTIVGNKEYGQIGLVEKVEEHNKYITADKQFKAKMLGGGFILSGLWAVVANKLFS